MPITILSLVLLACALPAAAETRAVGLELKAVEDGDTLVVAIDGTEQRVQIAEIDAPEDTDNPKLRRDLERTGLQPAPLLALGAAATAHLARLLAHPADLSITLDPERRDRYGRLEIQLTDPAGKSFGRQMVVDGYARCLCDSCCLALERQAIDGELGLWAPPTRSAALRWAEREGR